MRALQLIHRLLVVFEARRFLAGEARDAVLRHVACDLHLARQRKHVRREARVHEHARVEFLRLGVGNALVEQRRRGSRACGAYCSTAIVCIEIFIVVVSCEVEWRCESEGLRDSTRAGWRWRLSGETMLASMSNHWRLDSH